MHQVKKFRDIPSPIILPFVLILGIFTTFFRAMVLNPGSASLGVFIETIYYTSFILFFCSLFLLLIDFKRTRKSKLLWIHFLIAAPLSLMLLYNLSYNKLLDLVETTTPNKFITQKISDPEVLGEQSEIFESLADSLLDVQVIGVKSDSASRYFYGSFYEDDINRKFAIDLTPEVKDIKYLKFKVSNLYLHPENESYVVGFFTSKFKNPYAVTNENPEGIDYESSVFVGKISTLNSGMLVLKEYGLNCISFERCEYHMEKNFLKGRREHFKFNINDSRFWSENNFISRLEDRINDLENNIWKESN